MYLLQMLGSKHSNYNDNPVLLQIFKKEIAFPFIHKYSFHCLVIDCVTTSSLRSFFYFSSLRFWYSICI